MIECDHGRVSSSHCPNCGEALPASDKDELVKHIRLRITAMHRIIVTSEEEVSKMTENGRDASVPDYVARLERSIDKQRRKVERSERWIAAIESQDW